MTGKTVRANETTVPVLSCVSPEETLEFYEALGFTTTYRMTKPYLYLALEWSGFSLHFAKPPAGTDPAREDVGGCLVMVDELAPYHAAFTEAMRRSFGKVLASGRPRITRYRPGATRFTLVDPSGNSIIFIQRDEPEGLEYGGSKSLEGLARVLDNVRILREFKNDDRAAFRAVDSWRRRHGEQAPAAERAMALATLVELAVALGEPDKKAEFATELRGIQLTGSERERVEVELGIASALEDWLREPADPEPDSDSDSD